MANAGSNILDRTTWEKYSSFQMVHTPRLGRIMAYWSLGLFSLVVLGTFLPWTQNIRSRGTLTTLNPEDRPQTVHSTIAGRIEKWKVQEGQFVKKGDTLMVLSEIKDNYFDPQYLMRLKEQLNAKQGAQKATESKADALRNQIEALRSALQFSLEKAQNKVRQSQLKVESDSIDFVASKTDFEIAQQQFQRQEKLYQQGLKSLTELEARRLKLQESQAKRLSSENKWYASRNELLNARIELSSLKAEYRDKISKAEADLSSTIAYVHDTESEIAKMTNAYANLEIRNSFYQVTAPQDGYVVKALRAGTGETIKEGEAVVTLMPSDPQLAVELFVQPMDIPLISKGRKVRLQFDGWPTLVFSGWPGVSFGTFGGIVAVIDNLDTGGTYRILVVPDPEEKEPWPNQLRVGSGVYGWAMLNDVPIWYELWRQLNGFPPDYVGKPADKGPSQVKKDSKEK